MAQPPTLILETERLLFRRLVMADFDALYALYRDPEMRQYYPEGVLSEADTKEELEWFLNGHPKHPELGLWATIYKPNGAFIGRCGLLPWTLEGRDEVEVAYMIDKRYWGQGLGTEAARGIRDYGFNTLYLRRLICMVDPNNAASAKVATNIGMTLEKEAVDEFGPFLLFAMEKEAE
ncbi:MAG: GNAT family N-acetyltransferase [Anaerolineae bacterium]